MKTSHILLLVAIAVAVGFVISTLGDASTYVTFPSAEAQMGKKVTVIGELNTNKPIDYQAKKNQLSFFVVDSLKNEREVLYGGPKPQDFERSEKITLTGYAKDSVFIAEKILMKCPSKYNDQNTVEASSRLNY